MPEQLAELRETLTSATLLKNMIKDTEEQPDEEFHWARVWESPKAGAFVPVELVLSP